MKSRMILLLLGGLLSVGAGVTAVQADEYKDNRLDMETDRVAERTGDSKGDESTMISSLFAIDTQAKIKSQKEKVSQEEQKAARELFIQETPSDSKTEQTDLFSQTEQTKRYETHLSSQEDHTLAGKGVHLGGLIYLAGGALLVIGAIWLSFHIWKTSMDQEETDAY